MTSIKEPVAIHWFRRDLRLHDNTALYHALKENPAVVPLFIFDTQILDELPRADKRLVFIHQTLESLDTQLRAQGSGILCLVGDPIAIWKQLISTYTISAVYVNRDYEPYARKRDEAVEALCRVHQIPMHSYKDHVLMEMDDVLKDDGTPYTVFTPYSKKYKSLLPADACEAKPSEKYLHHLQAWEVPAMPSLEALGFTYVAPGIPSSIPDQKVIRNYHETRDFPALNGTSKMSVHLRFGTVSVRTLMRTAIKLNEKYFNELIWREFYQMILWHFPHVVGHAFKKEYDALQWRNHPDEFEAWCNGMTGYPIVDAGMRELNATGYMHNRVRMIVASFLTKDLLIDWRWGEAYFAEKLLDFDLASNNGGWQWAAGCGVDAAPYFRIFNPAEQTKKFDPKGIYIRRWVPELDTMQYPHPIVDHALARKRTLEAYAVALKR